MCSQLLLRIRGSERVSWEGGLRPPVDDVGVYPRPPSGRSEYELFHNTRYLGQMSVGAVAHTDVMRSMELFGTRVAPVVREEVPRRHAGRRATPCRLPVTREPESRRGSMKSRAAVLTGVNQPWEVMEVDVREPKANEVLIRYVAAGLCHSDMHLMTGDLLVATPYIGGHEGAGIVEKVGPGVSRVKEGDHVVCAFIPACGHCRWCASGQQSICDLGATILEGCLPDGSYAFSIDGRDAGAMCMLGTFSQYATISETSAVPVDEDLPLETAVLCGCGVPTGWGSAVNTGNTQIGDTVVVFGIGGIGANAVQGASHAGATNIVAVDPKANKREFAQELGATHGVAGGGEAIELASELTRGVGADVAIVTVDVVNEQVVAEAVQSIRKGGVVVLTGLAHPEAMTVHWSGTDMTLFRKQIRGSLFGDCNPTQDIKKMLALYRSGKLKLDELVTKQYTLDQINDGYADLEAGKNIRGVIVHEH